MDKQIIYDRQTRDFAMYLDGELVGFAANFHEAEVTLDQLIYDILILSYNSPSIVTGVPEEGN